MVTEASASHLVSLINGQMMPDTPQSLEKKNHLRLSMNDIEEPVEGLVSPSALHVERLVTFIRQWDRSMPLVIHCWAGVSRSTAAAFIALCDLNSAESETRIAQLLRERSPTAAPNQLLISYADQYLERSGRMIQAIELIGRGQVASHNVPFSTPSILDREQK